MISGRIMVLLWKNRREIPASPGSGAILVRTDTEEEDVRQFVRVCDAWFEMLKMRFDKSFLIAIDDDEQKREISEK